MKWQKLNTTSIMLILLASATSALDYEDWVYNNFPIIEYANIKIEFKDKNFAGWCGLYTPYKIQLVKECFIFDGVLSTNYLRMLVTHELTHHYCFTLFNNMDISHMECFPPEYNLS